MNATVDATTTPTYYYRTESKLSINHVSYSLEAYYTCKKTIEKELYYYISMWGAGLNGHLWRQPDGSAIAIFFPACEETVKSTQHGKYSLTPEVVWFPDANNPTRLWSYLKCGSRHQTERLGMVGDWQCAEDEATGVPKDSTEIVQISREEFFKHDRDIPESSRTLLNIAETKHNYRSVYATIIPKDKWQDLAPELASRLATVRSPIRIPPDVGQTLRAKVSKDTTAHRICLSYKDGVWFINPKTRGTCLFVHQDSKPYIASYGGLLWSNDPLPVHVSGTIVNLHDWDRPWGHVMVFDPKDQSIVVLRTTQNDGL